MSQATALQKTIDVLLERGSLDADSDAARIALAQGLAAACDDHPGNSSMWREYRAAETALFDTREGESDAALAVVESMRAPVGDAKNTRAPHTRRASSRGG